MLSLLRERSHPAVEMSSKKKHPRLGKVFYGWWVLGLVVITNLMSAPGQTSGFAPFVEPMMEVTGLSRQALANTYLVATLTSALFLIPAGKRIDTWGSRRVVVLASLGMALVLVMMTQLGRWSTGHATVGMIWLGLAGMRFTGQVLMMVAGQTAVSKWFVRRRGLAAGLVGFMASLMSPLSPLLLHHLIEGFGWRGAWWMAAGLLGVLNTPLVLFFWRDTPESCGLQPDGGVSGDQEVAVEEDPWTRREALGQPLLWVVVVGSWMTSMIVTAVSFHIVQIGAMRGLESGEALRFFLPMIWTSMGVGLVMNVLADRCSYRLFLPLQQLCLGLALLVLTFSDRFTASALIFGLTLALAGPVGVTTLPRWFGRKHLGAIGSVNWTAVVMGSAVGPSLFNLNQGDGYRSLSIVCAVVMVGLLMAGFLLPAPKR